MLTNRSIRLTHHGTSRIYIRKFGGVVDPGVWSECKCLATAQARVQKQQRLHEYILT